MDKSDCTCIDIRQLINTVKFLSIYSKDYILLSTHTYLFHPLELRKAEAPHRVYGGIGHQGVNMLGGARLLLENSCVQHCPVTDHEY